VRAMTNKKHWLGAIYPIRYFLLVIYFLLLTFFFTRPLISQIATHSVGGYGDNVYFVWMIGWIKQAVFDLGQMPYRSHLLNFPYGYNLAMTEIAPLQLLIGLPFALFDHPLLGYNVSMLATFFISGLTMFYWAHHLTRSWGASLVSSTAFAILPYHCAHFLIGHLNIAAIQWFPLYFMGFTLILTEDRFSWKNILIMSAGYAGIALSSVYYIYIALFISMVIVVIFAFKQDAWLKKETWKQLAATAAITLPFSIVGTVPYYIMHRGVSSGRTLENVMGFSASITDFLLPFTKSVIGGKWVFEHFPRDLWNEATLYLGLPVILLAIVAIIKRRETSHEKTIQILVACALIALVLAMGTNLTWMEKPVTIQTPEWLRGIIRQDTFYIFLPGYLLFKYFPFYNIMRAWMRFGIIVMLAACTLAGLGAALLLKNMKEPARLFTAAGLVGLVILDFMNTPFGTTRIEPREVDLWLADQPAGGQVQLPLEQSFQEKTIYFTLASQKPLIGVVPTFPSNRYFQLEPLLRNFPDQTSVDALKQEQVTYIVVDESEYDVDDAFISQTEALGLEFACSLDGQSVFIIQ
jgi:hypothetical protein